MKRTNIMVLGRSNLLYVVYQNYRLLIFCFAFILGLLIGSLVVKNSDSTINNLVSETFDTYISNRTGQTFFKTFFYSFTSLLPYLLVAYFLGVSIIGVFFVPFVALVRGLGIGLLSGFLYSTYSLRGIAFTVLLIAPYCLVSTFGLILACRESFGFSLMLLKAASAKGGAINIHNDYRLYCIRYLFIIIIFIVSAFLDSVMSLAFMRFFNFQG